MDTDGAVLRIVARGGPRSRRRDLFVDDVPVVTTSRDVVRALDIEDGSVVNPERLRTLILAEEPHWANRRAMQLLGYRERSHVELRNLLKEDGYSPQTSEGVLERLEDMGLLDDERFAAAYVRTKVSAGWGPRRVAEGLRRAGLVPDLCERILQEEYPEDDCERARELLDASRIATTADAHRAIARLVRRGFSYSVAREAAFDALDDSEDAPHRGHSS